MNLLERVLMLLRANVDALIEKAEDPQAVLRQLQLDMRNQLVQVKTQVATAIASVYQLQRRSREKQEEAEHWLKKAEQALQQGDEEAARVAVSHYTEINRLIERFEQQRQEQERFVSMMRDVLMRLEARFNEIESSVELLQHRQRQALIQQRVLEALQQSGGRREQGEGEQGRTSHMEGEAQTDTAGKLPQSRGERASRRPSLQRAEPPGQVAQPDPSRAAARLKSEEPSFYPTMRSNGSDLQSAVGRQDSLPTALSQRRNTDPLSDQPSPELRRLLETLKAARLGQNED
jgi:phage shock protein A